MLVLTASSIQLDGIWMVPSRPQGCGGKKRPRARRGPHSAIEARSSRLRLGLLIDDIFCKSSQRLVGRLFLVKRLLKQLGRAVEAQLLSPGAQRAVTRNLVMFHSLG